MADTEPAVTVCFDVVIDGESGSTRALGFFNSCEGLGCEVVMEQREEGGNNGFVWQLPTRLKYSNIKLSRAVGPETTKVTQWIAETTAASKPKTAVITAKTVEGTTVASWSLYGVRPVRWTGPTLNLESPKVATETIEISHQGFLPEPVYQ